MSDIQGTTVTYGSNGDLQGYLAVDGANDQPRPGVLVIHEWWGLDEYIKRRARMLADLGYVALAVDMYGAGKVAQSADEAGSEMNAVLGDIPTAEARLDAAIETLRSHPMVDGQRIAAIGYCFGGAMVLHAARTGRDLNGVVSFHGALGSFHTPAPGSVKAEILVCHGADDALVPDEQIAAFKSEMETAEAKVQFEAYEGALHGFTNPDADENGQKYGLPLAYDADIDNQSWQEMQEFFGRVLA